MFLFDKSPNIETTSNSRNGWAIGFRYSLEFRTHILEDLIAIDVGLLEIDLYQKTVV